MPRYFTRAEADALIPVLSEIVREMQAQKRRLDELHRQIREAGRKALGNGHLVEDAAQNIPGEVQRLSTALNERLQRLHDLGAELKSLEMGILDLPTIQAGREGYLCWRLGEPRVQYWHDLESGFAGRQPLPPDA